MRELVPGEIYREDFQTSTRCKHCGQEILWMDTVGKWFAQDDPGNVFVCPVVLRRWLAAKARDIMIAGDRQALNHEPDIIGKVDEGFMDLGSPE